MTEWTGIRQLREVREWSSNPEADERAAREFRLRRDTQIDTYTAGINSPVHVRVVHRPTGMVAEATAPNALTARESAWNQLRQQLSARRWMDV